MDYEFCQLLGRFDAAGGPGHYAGVKSTAHWVGHYCSMSAGTARERVRVARCLPQMPRAAELFRQGRLSYSKVRELTRLAGLVDDDELCQLALEMTASQLARTVRAYRSADGTRIQAVSKRQISTVPTGDGMVRMTIVLGAEEAAVVSAAIETAARQQQASGAADSGQPVLDVPAGTPQRLEPADRVQALVDVAACYLDSDTRDPADDHTLVIVHVNAEQLTEPSAANVPAGTSGAVPARASANARPEQASELASPTLTGTPERGPGNVPAGTSESPDLLSQVCFVEGHGPIESATAQRLACTSQLLGAVIDRHGTVLALGTSSRLASRAQRRALRVRDHGVCQFPGCSQTRHLEAHHLVSWRSGGPTDLSNLVLLCRRHHVLVHEGGVCIRHRDADEFVLPGHRFRFQLPDGTPISGTWRAEATAEVIQQLVAAHAARVAAEPEAGEPTRIHPRHGGEGFSLHECVRVLFDIQTEAAPAAA